MAKLIALRPVLYQGRMYEEGETLPAYDTRMVEAWLEAGSAEMDPPESSEETTASEGQEGRQEPENAQGGQEPSQGTDGAENAAEPDKSAENRNTTEGERPMVEGHLDPKQLATMKKDALEKLADQLGVDISEAKNNAERAAIISAVTVQAPANENGGAL